MVTDKTEKNEKNPEAGHRSSKLVSILLMVLALAYIVLPIDYDGPLIGYIDDFFLFTAALCYFVCQFSETIRPGTRKLLSIISIILCVLGIMWLSILAFTPIRSWVA